MDAPTLPVDDAALDAVEHALAGALDDVGDELRLVGADYNLHQLLDFWAGIDRATDRILIDDSDTPVYELTKPTFSERDLIRALIAEIRRLRDSEQY